MQPISEMTLRIINNLAIKLITADKTTYLHNKPQLIVKLFRTFNEINSMKGRNIWMQTEIPQCEVFIFDFFLVASNIFKYFNGDILSWNGKITRSVAVKVHAGCFKNWTFKQLVERETKENNMLSFVRQKHWQAR